MIHTHTHTHTHVHRSSRIDYNFLGPHPQGCAAVENFGFCQQIWDLSEHVVSVKWMVYFMENPIKTDDLGVPLF